MTKIEFSVPGKPVPQSRPRGQLVRGHIHIYEPDKCREYKDSVATVAKLVMRQQKPLEGPLACRLIFYMPIPKKTSRKQRAELIGAPCIAHNGDIENLAKGVLDAMNGIVWHDDSQIAALELHKRYEEEPRVEIEVEEWEVGGMRE